MRWGFLGVGVGRWGYSGDSLRHLGRCPSMVREEPEGKTQRAKTSENFAEERMFAGDISEDFSEHRRDHLYTGF